MIYKVTSTNCNNIGLYWKILTTETMHVWGQVTYLVNLCACVSHQVTSNSLRPYGLQLARLLCPWNSPGKNTSGLPFPSPGYIPDDPRIEPGSPTLQTDSLPSEPPGKPLSKMDNSVIYFRFGFLYSLQFLVKINDLPFLISHHFYHPLFELGA